MSEYLTIENHGQLIVKTNYWDTEQSHAGLIHCSCNAGAIRILLPRSHFGLVGEVRSSKYAIVSVGPWPAERKEVAVEILFEDGTDSPYTLHFGSESFDLIPAEPKLGEEWIVSLWVLKHGKPQKALERAAKYRRVESIPCLKEWSE